jgi:hypothetical protein
MILIGQLEAEQALSELEINYNYKEIKSGYPS